MPDAINLTPSQNKAADEFLSFMMAPDETAMVIYGHAGTGKSTLVQHILDTVKSQMKLINTLLSKDPNQTMKVFLTATTNKAAKVLSDKTGHQVKTIHSFLNLVLSNDYKTGETKLKRTKKAKVIRNALIIIDEASFLDRNMLNEIDELTENCKLLFIGDAYQLAQVNIKRPPVFNLDVRKAPLTEVMRNSGAILDNSASYRNAVKTGCFEPLVPDNDRVVTCTGSEFQAEIDKAFADPNLGDEDIKVVAWTNKRVIQYNDYIRKLRGLTELVNEGERMITNKPILGTTIGTDQYVTVTKVGKRCTEQNVPGRWVEVDYHERMFLPESQQDVKQVLKVHAQNKDWSEYFAVKDHWLDLRPPFACTVHKSQGSTYKRVFIDLADIGRCNIAEDVARMLYVAVSRGQNQVLTYGKLPVKYGGV